MTLHGPKECPETASVRFMMAVGQIPYQNITSEKLCLEIPSKKKWPKVPADQLTELEIILEYLYLKYEIQGIWPSDPLKKV